MRNGPMGWVEGSRNTGISRAAGNALYWGREVISAVYEFALFGDRRYGAVIDVPGDYATVALALAGAEVAAATVNSRVLIRLQEGTYDAYFPMDTYYFVDVQGMGIDLTTIAYSGDSFDTFNFGGGDCILYDCTVSHNGSGYRAGHKDAQIETSKLTYSRGGAVRVKFTGLGKSGCGFRLWKNQEFAFIDCDVTTDTTEAIYHNNASATQTAPGRLYLINTNATSTAAEGLTIYSNGSTQKDEVIIIGGTFVGGGSHDIRMLNAGSGAGEFDLWIDPSTIAARVTVTNGTKHVGIGRVYSAQFEPTNYTQVKSQLFFGAVAATSTTGWKIYPVTDTYGVRLKVEVWSSQENAYINTFDIDPYDGRLYVRRILQANGGFRISSAAPASSSASGEAGMLAWDATYLYVCTASNTWKRLTLTAY